MSILLMEKPGHVESLVHPAGRRPSHAGNPGGISWAPRPLCFTASVTGCAHGHATGCAKHRWLLVQLPPRGGHGSCCFLPGPHSDLCTCAQVILASGWWPLGSPAPANSPRIVSGQRSGGSELARHRAAVGLLSVLIPGPVTL